jgi:hypothetical protein
MKIRKPDKETVLSTAFIVLLWLAMAALASAGEPVAKINGKPDATKAAKQGDLIVLDSKDSTPDTKRKWVVWPELKGSASQIRESVEALAEQLKQLDPDATIILSVEDNGDNGSISLEGDTKLVLASYPGIYRVMLAVADKEGGLAVARCTVTVTGVTSTPPTPPSDPPSQPPSNPPTTPDPPVTPPGGFISKYDLDTAAKLWLVQIPNEMIKEKPAMHKIFAAIGRGAADGKYSSIKEIDTALGNTINDADKNKLLTKPAWNSWAKSCMAALTALMATGDVKTPQDYGQALLEVAEGLK